MYVLEKKIVMTYQRYNRVHIRIEARKTQAKNHKKLASNITKAKYSWLCEAEFSCFSLTNQCNLVYHLFLNHAVSVIIFYPIESSRDYDHLLNRLYSVEAMTFFQTFQ